MLFNSYVFVFAFLPIILLAWWHRALSTTQRLAMLTAASYVFYGWWDYRFLSLIALSTLVDYIVGLRIHAKSENKKAAKAAFSTVHGSVVNLMPALDTRHIREFVGNAFMALEDNTTIVYLCDQRYNPNGEFEIHPLDPTIAIAWPSDIEPLLSPKDAVAPYFLDVHESLVTE